MGMTPRCVRERGRRVSKMLNGWRGQGDENYARGSAAACARNVCRT